MLTLKKSAAEVRTQQRLYAKKLLAAFRKQIEDERNEQRRREEEQRAEAERAQRLRVKVTRGWSPFDGDRKMSRR